MHSAAEVRLGGFEQQVIVVRHQDPGVDAPSIDLDRRTEGVQETAAIAIIEEDVLLPIAAGGDMPDRIRVLESQRTCHQPRAYPRPYQRSRPNVTVLRPRQTR